MKKKRSHHKLKKTPFYLKYKSLLLRTIIFFSLAFLIIPFIIKSLSKNLTANVQFNFFSFSAYILAIIVFFIIFNRKIILNHQFELKPLQTITLSIISFSLFSVYYYLKFLTSLQQATSYIYTTLLIYFLGMCFLALAAFTFDFFKKFWFSLTISLTIIYTYFMLTQIAWNHWYFFSAKVTKIVYYILNLFYQTVILTINGDPKLILSNFSVIIGPPCSGIEGLSMFIALFALLLAYDYINLDLKRTSIIFFLGLIGTYFINILRVTLIMIIGTKYPQFALGMFHSNAGWLFFSGFILLLLFLSYGWMKKKN